MKKAVGFLLAVLLLALSGAVSAAQPGEADLNAAWNIIRSKQFVDLTHAFEPGIPHWKGFPDEKREKLYSYSKDGFVAHLYTHVGQ